MRLFQNAKIQDLNVIHNGQGGAPRKSIVVSECKDTRFECNSQQLAFDVKARRVVSECKDTRFECNSQLGLRVDVNCAMLFQNAKIQDLNVIHNIYVTPKMLTLVVSECKDTRFECNSQLGILNYIKLMVVSECKDTRFECNSQHRGYS